MNVLLSTPAIIGIIVVVALVAINIAIIVYILQRKPQSEEAVETKVEQSPAENSPKDE